MPAKELSVLYLQIVRWSEQSHHEHFLKWAHCEKEARIRYETPCVARSCPQGYISGGASTFSGQCCTLSLRCDHIYDLQRARKGRSQ